MDPNDQNQNVPPGDGQVDQGGIQQPQTPPEPTPAPEVPGAPAPEPEVPPAADEGEIAPPPPVVEEQPDGSQTPGTSGPAI